MIYGRIILERVESMDWHRADEPPVCVPACSCTHADRRASHRQATKRILACLRATHRQARRRKEHEEEKIRRFSHQASLYELCPTWQEGTKDTKNINDRCWFAAYWERERPRSHKKINTCGAVPTFTLYPLTFTFFLCPHYHEKLTSVKLIFKLFINILLEIFKRIIDHNILLCLSGYGGQARK